MPPDLLNILIPAPLALLGTVLGLWLGHRRWSSELRMKRLAAFDGRCYETYQELWNVLEAAHMAMMTSLPEKSEVRKLEQNINILRLKHGIYLDAKDASLAGSYFTAVIASANIIADSGSRKISAQFPNTAAFSQAEIESIEGLRQANDAAERMREELIARIRTVLCETSYACQ